MTSPVGARAFVRDYARAIGLDSDEVVNEFCRLFPVGDRRGSRLIQAQAQLLGHHLSYAEAGGLPPQGDRRHTPVRDGDSTHVRNRLATRALATAIDACASLTIAGMVSIVAGTVMYYTAMTMAFGSSPGAKAVDAIRHRLPSLSDVGELQKV